MTLKIPKKLKELEKFLFSDAVSEDSMLLSELDGFMAGIAVCPALIMPGEWIPVIWAGEEPVFENEEQAQNIMSILMGRPTRRHAPLAFLMALELWIGEKRV